MNKDFVVNKKNNFIKKAGGLALVFAMALSCTACGKVDALKDRVQRKAYVLTDENVVSIPITDDSIKIRDMLFASNNALSFSEAAFPDLLNDIQGRDIPTFPEVDTNANLSQETIGENEVYYLGNDESDCIVFYIHGGAYTFGADKLHVSLCDKLASSLNAKVYIPLYPLVPEATYEEAYAFMDEVYERAFLEGKPIYIMGDSAGGGFALGFAEHLNDNGMPMPDRIVLYSPWVDMTLSNPDVPYYDNKDVTLRKYGLVELGKLWAGGEENLKNSMVSPIYGNLDGLPPTLMVTGTYEVMYPDIIKLYGMLKKSDNKAKLVIGDGMWHFFVANDTPEAYNALDYVVDFCKN